MTPGLAMLNAMRIAAAATAEILAEYLEELEDRDPTDLRTVEEITLDIAGFIEERMPAGGEGLEEEWG